MDDHIYLNGFVTEVVFRKRSCLSARKLFLINGNHLRIQWTARRQKARTKLYFDWLIDDYAKDGGPEVVCHLCSSYQDLLWS